MESAINGHAVGVVLIFWIIIVLFSPILEPLLLALFGGRKFGFLKHAREIQYTNVEPDKVWQLFIDRLNYDGFTIEESEPGLSIRASRKGVKHDPHNPMTAYKHAELPLKASVNLNAEGDNTNLSLTIQYREFIVADTGEGKYLERLAERLISADLQQNPPVVANPSMNISIAFMLSIMMLVGGALTLTPMMNASHCIGLMIGYVASLMVILPLLLFGAVTVFRNPGEISGLEKIIPTLILILMALMLTGSASWIRHRETYAEEWQYIQSKHREQLNEQSDKNPTHEPVSR
ncbi:hypothetical protein JXA32_14645 [Candidatus Sumerlaeota bacterium]|nr:hypothetical protein [Candidatus Sumerlaeota bacterium]